MLNLVKSIWSSEARRARRHASIVPATMCIFDDEHEIAVTNISAKGFSARIPAHWKVGYWTRIRLDEACCRDAQIVWRKRGVGGCEFLLPLSQDELAKLVR